MVPSIRYLRTREKIGKLFKQNTKSNGSTIKTQQAGPFSVRSDRFIDFITFKAKFL